MAKPSSQISFFVSVHIPKTAGTTVATILDRSTRRKILFDYPSMDTYFRPDPLFAKNAQFISEYFKGIHGHFGITRHLGAFPLAKYIATVRHPVDRIISQYLHELNEEGPDSLWHKAIVDGMSVIDFAAQPGVTNAMATHLAGLDLDDYDLLMLTENLPASLELLNYVVGNLDIEGHFGRPPKLPQENSGSQRSAKKKFGEATRKEIFRRCAPDVEVYRRAEELLRKKADQFLKG